MKWATILAIVPMSLSGIATLFVVLTGIAGRLDAISLLCAVLVGFAALVLISPWISLVLCRQRWVVRPGEVTTTIPFLGFGWSWTSEVEWLNRIDLRRISSNAWKWRFRWQLGYGEAVPFYELALVDLDDHTTVVLGPLTEGEARWMGGIIAEQLKDALPKKNQSFERWSVTVNAPVAGSQAMADPYLDEPIGSSGSIGSSARTKGAAPRG